jgi:hypothetical protein
MNTAKYGEINFSVIIFLYCDWFESPAKKTFRKNLLLLLSSLQTYQMFNLSHKRSAHLDYVLLTAVLCWLLLLLPDCKIKWWLAVRRSVIHDMFRRRTCWLNCASVPGCPHCDKGKGLVTPKNQSSAAGLAMSLSCEWPLSASMRSYCHSTNVNKPSYL